MKQVPVVFMTLIHFNLIFSIFNTKNFFGFFMLAKFLI